MRYYEPRIQELIEELQGALRMFTREPVFWLVLERIDHFTIECDILYAANAMHKLEYSVSRRVLEDPYWPNMRRQIVRACILKLVDDAKPAASADVQFIADPRQAVME